MYIITSPKDVAIVYRHPDCLTFEGFVKDMYVSFGMSAKGLAKMFGISASKDNTATDHADQKHVHLGTGIQREQLHPGKHLDDLVTTYIKHIRQQMDWTNIPNRCKLESLAGKNVVSLRK